MRDLGHRRVAPVRDERGHPADRVRAAPVAGPDEQLRVGAHERHGHRQLGAVGHGQLGPRPELLDAAEQVVPAAGVEPRGVLAQLVQDLVHLERGEDRLDQDGRPDRPARDPERDLGVDEDLVPEPRLVVRFELGEVEVRPAAASEQLARRCGTGTARSRTGWPRPARRRRASPTRRGASRAAGRRASRVLLGEPVGLALGRIEGERAARTASISAAWPPTTLAHVGESESSRSAMNTRAPELSALIIILGSAGPVISTRRSSKSARCRGDGPVRLADLAASRRGSRAGRRRRARAWRSWRRSMSEIRDGPNRRWRSATNARASSVRIAVGARDRIAAGARRRAVASSRQPSPRRTVASIRPCGSVVGV